MTKRYYIGAIVMALLSVPLLAAQSGKAGSGKGYLGVQIQDVSRKIEKRFKLPSDEGAYITEVVDDSPAEKAGLKEDDVVLSFDGRAVYDADDLTRFVQRTSPDTKVDVVVWRDAAKKTVSVIVGKRKNQSFAFYTQPGNRGPSVFWTSRISYGLELNTLNEQLGAYFGVPDKKGVLVESVKKESAAAKAGFQAGDVITKVGKERVSESGEVAQELSDYEAGDKVDVEVYRKGSKKTLTLEVEEADDDDAQFYLRGFNNGAMHMPHIMGIPAPDVDIRIREFDEQKLEEAQRRLEESLHGLRDKEIRLREIAPKIHSIKTRLTI